MSSETDVLDTDLTNMLTAEIRNLIAAKEGLDAMAEECKHLKKASKDAKERILDIMTRGNIDKANFDRYAVSVAKSNRKEGITAKNLCEILKRSLPDKDAEEIAAKVVASLESVSQPFIRMSKSKK